MLADVTPLVNTGLESLASYPIAKPENCLLPIVVAWYIHVNVLDAPPAISHGSGLEFGPPLIVAAPLPSILSDCGTGETDFAVACPALVIVMVTVIN
jgi:hypothetical protein